MRGRGLVSLLVVLGFLYQTHARGADWLPVTPEELQMTREPKAPGAPAIYLFTQVDRDDTDSDTYYYNRLKILTEEGRKWANVEIPFVKGSDNVRSIEARTIRPDGSIVPFDGTVFDKAIVSRRGAKLLAKTFTLPDVQPGSIIEYRYRYHTPMGLIFDSHWILSQGLFTRNGRYSLTPYPYFALQWSWPQGLPDGSSAPTKDHGRIRLETHDVPAFVTEELMPPANELRYRVDFIYSSDPKLQTDPVKFWQSFGHNSFYQLSKFVDRPKVMQRALAELVQPSDTPEEKLRKIYARVSQMRNTSFERSKTEEETQRESVKPAHNVEDVWNRGSGDAFELTYLFLALARAAGVHADLALVATRDQYFFNRRLMNTRQLNSNLVIVTLDGKPVYLDPGVPFTPFGLLPWNETAMEALRVDDDGGSWVSVPLPPATASRIEHKARLKLDGNGALKGKLTVRYTGLEAAWRRLTERNEDETDRKQFLEDQLRGSVPVGIEVELTNTPDWSSWEAPLVAEYDLEIPGWATAVGRRQLLRVGLFGNEEDHTFEQSTRVQPVYFDFPYQRADDIAVELPAGTRAASVPKAQKIASSTSVYSYDFSAETHDNLVHISRDLSIQMLLVAAKFYPELRGFYQTIRAGDEEQVVISYDSAPGQR
jgi:hypothetical protein